MLKMLRNELRIMKEFEYSENIKFSWRDKLYFIVLRTKKTIRDEFQIRRLIRLNRKTESHKQKYNIILDFLR